MYKKYYIEMASQSQLNYRKIEHEALINAIDQLAKGLEKGPESMETVKACAVLSRIWSIFMNNVINNDGHLSPELRANIISIGNWVQSELTNIGTGKSVNFSALIEINKIVADGLV